MGRMVDRQTIFLLDVAKLIQKAEADGFQATAGELWRPVEMQRLYVKMGRSKTMRSQHMNRLAIDLNLFKNGKLCSRDEIFPLGKWWEGLSTKHRWGGSWRGAIDGGRSHFIDSPHFEMRL